MSLSSTELNYLIWRYLQESGYDLAAFAFDKQSLCLKYEENKNLEILSKIEPGYLVNLVQKGLLYSLTEEDIKRDSAKSETLSFFGSLLNNEKDIELYKTFKFENNESPVSDMDVDEEVKVEVQELQPTTEFSESLLSKWNPSTNILAHIDNESNLSLGKYEKNNFASNKVIKTGTLTAFQWNPSGKTIITTNIAGDLCLWSSEGDLRSMTKGVLKSEDNKPSYIVEILWSTDGQFFLTSDSNGRICLWESSSLNLIQEMNKSTDKWSICWLDNFKFSLSTKPGSIILYQISSDFTSNYNVKILGNLDGHKGTVSNLQFNDNSKYLSSYSEVDGVIKLWTSSITAGEVTLNLEDKKILPLVSMDWFNKGENLITVSIDGTILEWNITDKSLKSQVNIFKHLKVKNSLVYASIISPDERWLAIGDDSGNVFIWDVINHHVKAKFIKSIDETNKGLCDLSWDESSTSLSVAYKGLQSVVLKWDF